MTGHRQFGELTSKFSPKRKARVAARVAELKAEMPVAGLRQAHKRPPEGLGKPSRKRRQAKKRRVQ
jgi:hypothetical protein